MIGLLIFIYRNNAEIYEFTGVGEILFQVFTEKKETLFLQTEVYIYNNKKTKIEK